MFNRRGRKPWASVNFITAHDGFTLHDLVSYNDKHNEANREGNQDGHSNNLSWNHGAEGPTDDPEIQDLRFRQKCNLLATLLLSQGTPMLLAGDEFGHSQRGNNNAYCQDNEITWFDWERIDEDGQALIAFVRKVIALRQAFPMLRRGRFLTGEYNADLGVKDVRWLTPGATDMEPTNWHDAHARCLGMLMDGRAQATGIKRPGMDATTLLVVNAHYDAIRFTLPEVMGGRTWRCLLDTNVPERDDAVRFRTGDDYEVAGRSLLLFALEPEGKPSVALRRAARALREVAETPVPVAVGNGEPAIQETQGTSRKQEVAAPDPDEKTAPALQRDRAGRSRPTMASEPKIVMTRYKRILDAPSTTTYTPTSYPVNRPRSASVLPPLDRWGTPGVRTDQSNSADKPTASTMISLHQCRPSIDLHL